MMDRNYPTSSFADPLAPPAQTVAWAYDRSTANIKPSASYGANLLDPELLQRQTYASTHQLPTYTTTHHPTGLPVFDSNSNTSETSIMNFLSAMESRSLQAGPASASLLPPFRTPPWPTGTNSSTTELYLTGALPSTAPFPSPATLASYQHASAFPSRSYAATPSLALQEPVFSSSANGLLHHHDPLLHLKQTVLPTALAFNHLSATALCTSLPIQSSTYRSAQESAPHLLQPQFSLLPSALTVSQSAPQPYGVPVFSGSIERALQRECSVIKHHQRPSNSHTATEQGYHLGSVGEGDVSYQQDPSRLTPVPCSPASGADPSQGVNGGPQPKAGSASQSYSSSIPSPGYSSAAGPQTKVCSSKMAPPHPSNGGEGHSLSQGHSGGSPESYSSPGLKQSSVIASQSSTQLPSLLSNSLPQIYNTSQAQASHSSSSDTLPSLYKTLPSFSMESASQTRVYSSSPGQGQEAQYAAQVQGLCLGNLSQSYSPSPHSQVAPHMSYPSMSQGQAGLSLTSSYVSARSQSLPTGNSPQGYSLMQSSAGGTADGALSQQQTPSHHLLSAPSPSYTSVAHAQALQNNCRAPGQDLKPAYSKLKLEELPLQELQALQQASMETSPGNIVAPNNVVYVVSKMDDRYNTQSVIRSSLRSEEHLVGSSQNHMAQVKDERMDSLSQQHSVTNPKTTEPQQQNHQNHVHTQAAQAQYIRLPNAQVLLDPNQMILLQQPLLHSGQKASMQPAPGSGSLQVQYLQMGAELIGSSVTGSQDQQGPVAVASSGPGDSKHLLASKDPYSQEQQDAKNHYALQSICFPESMMLADERNILSNVDDILAATAAACGVTPQDFVKATSGTNGDLSAMGNPADSKDPFQTVDIRHMSPSFSQAQHSIITNTNSHAMSLNGGHMTTEGHGGAVQPPNGSELHPNGDGSESDYHLAGQGYDSSGQQNRGKAKTKGIKREDSLMDSPCLEGFPKKKARSKGSAKPAGPEEENGQARPGKRSGQAKRQNSRGSDTSSPIATDPVYDSYQQQERIRQKIREVEEKQPEVKTGFIGSFLDFIKSGPKQNLSSTPARSNNRSRRPSSSSKQPPGPFLPLTPKLQQTLLGPGVAHEGHGLTCLQQKRLEEDLQMQRNLETLPSFSSDEEESVGKNQALQNSISSALSALDEPSERRHRTDSRISSSFLKPDEAPSGPQPVAKTHLQQTDAPSEASATALSGATVTSGQPSTKETPPGQLAFQLSSVAIEGLTDEDLSDSGAEGMYRERDEFVVRNEDIDSLKVTLGAGREPPAIWKVQKALLQKFVPELRDGKRVFSATNSYLGYFGDAKTMYQRVYVKFLDTVNKREYVRVCSRKPRCKPMNSMRGSQVKTLLGLKPAPSSEPLVHRPLSKPRPKQSKSKAEPPPKKRKKWKEEFSPTPTDSSEEGGGVDDEFGSTLPLSSRFLSTRTMKETFKSFVELLTSVALDEDVIAALERENDELLLPHLKRVDGMIADNRKRLLPKLHMGQLLKTALDNFPEISVVTELKKDGETPAFKVRLSGNAYNKKTMKPYKLPNKVPLEYTVDQQKTQWFSLYHSLQHYKYHTYLLCKEEIASLQVQSGELGQEQTVQLCMQNGSWVEGLFDRFGELLSQVQQVCR
ncbi:glutamine and serine-rich protein 1 [Aplochiton taeniatus]